MKIFAALLAALIGVSVHAQSDRPDEASLFGGSPPPAATTTRAEKSEKAESLDVKGLDIVKATRDAFASGEVPDNALQIGGIFYQRLDVSAQKNVSAANTPVDSPLQFDLFLDGRPSDRVRGFVDERLFYDSTRDSYGNTTSGNALGSQQFSSNSSAPTGIGTTSNVPSNPTTALDQAWLKFDIDRTVFVTAGKQHVKWGASRFWNPTDFLNTQPRDPLLPYDLRLGSTMVKFEIPLESYHTNLYAITLFDNPQPASTLGQFGEALRAETVFGKTEVGIDAVYRGTTAPEYGVDVSSALGPFDVYLEGAYIASSIYNHYQVDTSSLPAGADISTLYTSAAPQPSAIQVSGGANYSFAWRDNREATIGVEYFYNQLGYSDAKVYPLLIFLNKYQPFYTGKNYAAIYATAEGPDHEKHTSFTFSTLGNLSDGSFISRLDFSWRFLTYMTFEAYVDSHYGTQGGEFNFAMNTPALTSQGQNIPAIDIPPTWADMGVSLRLAF